MKKAKSSRARSATTRARPSGVREPEALRAALLAWYRAVRRDLPWRRTPSLYPVLLSEFMLQQTRVDQALPYYDRFMKRFPSLCALAEAGLDDVLKHWEGLGYYRRARFLHETAKRLAEVNDPSLEHLDGCPGIGPYTRAAIGSIVWGAALPVVDGNVNRVMARMLALPVAPVSTEGRRAVLEQLEKWIPAEAAGDWNQGIMELGATVCTPAAPKCGACPWSAWCKARAEGTQDRFPIVPPKPERPHKHGAAAVIRRKDGRVLVAQRPDGGLLANLWEFPGGLLEPGEDFSAGCARAVEAQVGLAIETSEEWVQVRHAFSHFSLTLHVFCATKVIGRPRARLCQAWKWLPEGELRTLAFPRAHWPVLEKIEQAAK
ncbi:MAG: A/G-specific adenine glycosylase [Planctomycetota bacterium]|nr:A/G-specific adenine glycosylase [Planctomycetota bacterium]